MQIGLMTVRKCLMNTRRCSSYVCWCRFISFFNKIEGTSGAGVVAKSKWNVNFPKMNSERASSLGFNIKEWESPHGTIQFVRTPIMTKDPFAYKAGFAD